MLAIAGWAFAAIGWFAFLFAERLYRINRRLRSEETARLAVLSLAIALSDGFRTAARAGCKCAIDEARARGADSQAVIDCLIEGMKEISQTSYQPEADPNTVAIVADALAAESYK